MTEHFGQMAFTSADVEVLQRDIAYDGFFSLHRVALRHRLFGGGWTPVMQRELFVRPPAVGVLLYDPQRRMLVLIEQFRVGALDRARDAADGGQPASPWLLELVAGLVEPGESPGEVAHREALEEAGCRIRELIPLPGYLASPGGSNEWISLYCGLLDSRQAGGIHGLDSENEDIRVVRVPLDEVREALERGQPANAMTLIALQWLLLNEERLSAGGSAVHGMDRRQDDSQ